MGTQAEALAGQLEAAIDEAVAAIAACSDTRWGALNPTDSWSVGVTAHHIASSVQPTFELVQAIATAQPLPPITFEMINAGNAQHALQFANCTKAETLDLLRSSKAGVLGQLRAFSDDQLARTAQFPPLGEAPVGAGQLVDMLVIGHVKGHLTNILAPA